MKNSGTLTFLEKTTAGGCCLKMYSTLSYASFGSKLFKYIASLELININLAGSK